MAEKTRVACFGYNTSGPFLPTSTSFLEAICKTISIFKVSSSKYPSKIQSNFFFDIFKLQKWGKFAIFLIYLWTGFSKLGTSGLIIINKYKSSAFPDAANAEHFILIGAFLTSETFIFPPWLIRTPVGNSTNNSPCPLQYSGSIRSSKSSPNCSHHLERSSSLTFPDWPICEN